MPHTISLKCFSEDFSTCTNINHERLSEAISNDKNFRIEKDNSIETLFIRNEEKEEWFPLLWLKDEYSYINSRPIFNLNLYYDLVRLAEKLDATILTEDDQILFTPAYGLFVDPEEGINEIIEVSELQEEIENTGNILQAVKNIKQNQNTQHQNTAKKPAKSKADELLSSRKATVIGIILTILFCLILVLKQKR